MKSWWKAVVSYPPSWIALAVVVGSVWTIIAFLEPPALMIAILLALAVVATVAWPITMSATGTLARLQFTIPKLTDIDAEELAGLVSELEALEDPRPAHQLRSLQQKRNNLAEVLGRRLDAGELTYARYLTTAQQVYEASLDNLHEVAVGIRSISAIDSQYIDQRLGELTDSDNTGGADQRERTSLEDRKDLRSGQEKKIADLLAQNESAMTVLDRTTTALADAPIGRAPEDAEAAMKALEELAKRASKYATG